MPVLINIEGILKSELTDLQTRIQKNIRYKYRINDYMRSVADTMRVETDRNSGAIWGWEFFENVETGIPPLIKYAPLRNMNVKQKIYDWSIKAGIQFDKDYKRRSFAYLLRRKILFEGTALYRRGGRKDIYTNEIPKTVEALTKKIGEIIVNTNIL